MKDEIYDKYAAAALQALITKAPFFDTKGEDGKVKTEEELQKLQHELCRSAHSYAAWMVQTRPEFVEYLRSNGITID